MRLGHSTPTLLSLLAILFSSMHPVQALPNPYPEQIFDPQPQLLEERQCAVPCGFYNQVCCQANQYCYTSNNQALCGAGAAVATAPSNGNGYWQYITATIVATDFVTRTTIYSSFVVAATPTAQTLIVTSVVTAATPALTVTCNPALNEVSCGSICCASGQFCQNPNVPQCAAYGGSSANAPSTVFAFTPGPSSASPFVRPTSQTVATITSTGTVTTTIPFQTPVGTDGSALTGVVAVPSNNGLSGGAIAGIVIGTLFALFLLFLLCACCCMKGLIDSILGCFGLGKKSRRRTTETTYIEERHSHHGSGRVAATGGRTWFGIRPARTETAGKTGGGFGGALGVAGALAALAVVLGLRRKSTRKEKAQSYGSGSSYSYSDYTSESSESTDIHTRDDRRSRR